MSIENAQLNRFERQCIKMESFHKKIIGILPDFDHENPLVFLELDGLRLCHTELIPERIINRGYNPNIDPQTIVLGTKNELKRWVEKLGLNQEEFIVEPSSFGYHIDIYGDDVLSLTGIEKNRLTERRYCKLLND